MFLILVLSVVLCPPTDVGAGTEAEDRSPGVPGAPGGLQPEASSQTQAGRGRACVQG